MIVGEKRWLTDVGGGVEVALGDDRYIVVESDWAETAGAPQQETTVASIPAQPTLTSPTPGTWTTVLVPNDARQEAYVCNTHSDPNTVVLVRGGPYGVKPVWPDSCFMTSAWKGAVQVMCPTHASVRISISEV